jgi:hypothetical protein
MITLYVFPFDEVPSTCTGISKMILVKGGHGFSNNCRSVVSNHFLNVKINFREHFPHFAVMLKDFYACMHVIVLMCFAELTL